MVKGLLRGQLQPVGGAARLWVLAAAEPHPTRLALGPIAPFVVRVAAAP